MQSTPLLRFPFAHGVADGVGTAATSGTRAGRTRHFRSRWRRTRSFRPASAPGASSEPSSPTPSRRCRRPRAWHATSARRMTRSGGVEMPPAMLLTPTHAVPCTASSPSVLQSTRTRRHPSTSLVPETPCSAAPSRWPSTTTAQSRCCERVPIRARMRPGPTKSTPLRTSGTWAWTESISRTTSTRACVCHITCRSLACIHFVCGLNDSMFAAWCDPLQCCFDRQRCACCWLWCAPTNHMTK